MKDIAVLPEESLRSPAKTKPACSVPVMSEVMLPAIKFPRFDPRSPSQVVFKPQWLGVGFGATGVRSRGVQNRGRGPSPLSTHRPATDENENKVVLNKPKQRGNLLLSCMFYLNSSVAMILYFLCRMVDFLSCLM